MYDLGAAAPDRRGERTMPAFIPKPEEQATYFQNVLEPGERIQANFWFEQRLFWLVQYLIDEVPLGELVFMKMRHRYFGSLTDRRLLIMGSTGLHKPMPEKLEALPRASVKTTNFRKWLGGGVSLDLQVNGELRRYRVPRSQVKQAEAFRSLAAT
jgi:hypothetical protein